MPGTPEDDSRLMRIEDMLEDIRDKLLGTERQGDIGLMARVGKVETKVNLAYTLGGIVTSIVGFMAMLGVEWTRK